MNDRPYVICADDDHDILALVALRLERSGFDVATANDGEEALALARARRPVVVVLDVMMPRLDGVDLVKTLRTDAELGDVKIVLLSARAQDTDVAGGHEAGADAYLDKPFKYTDLAEEIERLTS